MSSQTADLENCDSRSNTVAQGGSKPRISAFFGIVIRMFYNDHWPSHFPAEYGEYEAVYRIETIEVLRGKLPRRAHALVVEWTTLHRSELMENRAYR